MAPDSNSRITQIYPSTQADAFGDVLFLTDKFKSVKFSFSIRKSGRVKDMHETHEGEARGRRHSLSSSSVDKLQASSTRSRSSSRETVKSHSENKTALVNTALTDIQHIRETHKYLEKSLKTLRTEYQRDHNQMLHALEEERSRSVLPLQKQRKEPRLFPQNHDYNLRIKNFLSNFFFRILTFLRIQILISELRVFLSNF